MMDAASKQSLDEWTRSQMHAIYALSIAEIRRMLPNPPTRKELLHSLGKAGYFVPGGPVHASRLSRVPSSPYITKQNIRDLVNLNTATGCWEFRLRRDPSGYGRIGKVYAHRHSYELFKGPIENGLWVLHHCDNPACINPDHLHLGTCLDNIADRDSRRRYTKHNALINERIVRDVRERYAAGGITQKQLAAEYGVAKSVINMAIRRVTWKDVA